MVKSKLLTINQWDFIKGGIVAAITCALTTIIAILNAGNLPSEGDWKAIGVATISAFIAYIVKNMGTNSKGQIAKPEPVVEKVEEPK